MKAVSTFVGKLLSFLGTIQQVSGKQLLPIILYSMDQLPRIFIAYARKDAELLEELRIHLRPLERTQRAVIWYDGKIEPGAVWEVAIKQNLHAADIILLLLSAHAIDSDYFYEKEMTDALKRHEQGEARVVPLIIKPCTWRATPLSKLQALPKDGKAVTSWGDRDEAWNDAVESLLKLIEVRENDLEGNHIPTVEEPLAAFGIPLNDPFAELMIPIQGGSFDMGDEHGDLKRSCQPLHLVTVGDFFLCKQLVTQAQWQAIMGNNPSHFKGDDLPVEQVSWNDVKQFIKKLNDKTGEKYRLPSEAEWEYAARGGKLGKVKYLYAGSNDLNEVAWYEGNSGKKTQPVMQKKPNELGLYDMNGNVWEWCEDIWHDNYDGAPKDGSAWGKDVANGHWVVRGGSWDNKTRCRVARREMADALNKRIGFRLAR